MSDSAIVVELARDVARRIAHRTVCELQRIEETLAPEDSGLRSVWDAICVQVQEEHSIHWEIYDQTVRESVRRQLEGLSRYECEALWLQTEPGIHSLTEGTREGRVAIMDMHDIVEYVTVERVYVLAEEWSNSRIRAFIRRARTWD